jgi:hypothetical protein
MKKVFLMLVMSCGLMASIRYDAQRDLYYTTQQNIQIDTIEYDHLARIVATIVKESLLGSISLHYSMNEVFGALEENGSPAALALLEDLEIICK